LQRGPLARAGVVRDLSGLAALILLVAPPAGVTYWVTLPIFLLGEFAERHLFFRAVDAPKMPGVPSA
jgi:hypothetical protein